MCKNKGHTSGVSVSDFSEILDIINNMKANFNAENV